MATDDVSTMDFTTDYGASTTIESSTDGSTDTSFTYFTPSTTRSTSQAYFTSTEQWWTTYSTRVTTIYNPPTYPAPTTNNSVVLILVIVLALGCIIFFIYCFVQNHRDKQRTRNLNNAVLTANNDNNNLRLAPTHPSTSVTVNDQLPDYDAVMMEPTAQQTLPARPQLIIPSFTQEDDSPPPNYVTPDVNALPFTLPLPPTYEEATSQPNSRRNSFTEIPLT